eukprot:363616-Chlamydomonas_euryale.AAC.1
MASALQSSNKRGDEVPRLFELLQCRRSCVTHKPSQTSANTPWTPVHASTCLQLPLRQHPLSVPPCRSIRC